MLSTAFAEYAVAYDLATGRFGRTSGSGVYVFAESRLQFSHMECKVKQRQSEEYFDALKRQQWISDRLVGIRANGDPEAIAVGERQLELAIEDCYECWRNFNEHSCSAECEQI